MLINDRSAFLKHKQRITIELTNGKQKNISIDLNMKTKNYFNMLCLLDSLQGAKNDKQQLYIIADSINEILENSVLKTDTNWILNNISQDSQVGLLNYVSEYINRTLADGCFKVPEIEVIKKSTTNSKGNKTTKEREEKKEEIQRLQNILKSKQDITLMDDIAFILKETSCTYTEIMNMPIFTYRDLTNTLGLIIARSDDDYNLAYLRYETKKYKEELNSGNKAVNQPRKQRGADLNKLKTMLNN